jgi:ABC-type phosphate transport system substrate-binding protein
VIWRVPEAPPAAPERPSLFRRLFRVRVWIYVAAILAILLFRLTHGSRPLLPSPAPKQVNVGALTIAGLDLAPVLIPRLVEEYRALYPGIDLRVHSGGTRQALQELANHEAAVAFLNRLPTPEERRAISAVTDTVETYPVALGGIEVLCSAEGGPDSLTVGDLRAWLGGTATRPRPDRFYAPDPNLGLWTSLTSALGLPDSTRAPVTWLAADIDVARAVAADPASLGFASTLSLTSDLRTLGARAVRVRGDSARAVLPSPGEIARGYYPLYHYLYLACLPQADPLASQFITFMYNGRGQRLVAREGYLPARQIGRVVQLVQKPLG